MHCDETMNKLVRPIDQAKIISGMSVDSLIRELDGCVFGAGRLAEAVDIYCDIQASDTTKFFGLAGAMVTAGMRSIVADLIRDGAIDVLVTTGANMVHDLVESLGLHNCKSTDITANIELKHEEMKLPQQSCGVL